MTTGRINQVDMYPEKLSTLLNLCCAAEDAQGANTKRQEEKRSSENELNKGYPIKQHAKTSLSIEAASNTCVSR